MKNLLLECLIPFYSPAPVPGCIDRDAVTGLKRALYNKMESLSKTLSTALPPGRSAAALQHRWELI
jgi:hypothetical protein